MKGTRAYHIRSYIHMYALAFSTSSSVVSRTMVSLMYAHGLLGGMLLVLLCPLPAEDGGGSLFSIELLEPPSTGEDGVGRAVYAI